MSQRIGEPAEASGEPAEPSRVVPTPTRAYVLCQILGWGAYGLVGVGMSRAFGFGSTRMDITTLSGAAIGAAVTHLWRGVMLRRGWLGLGFARLLPRLLAGVVMCAVICELFVWGIGLFVTRSYTMQSSTPGVMFATSFNWIFTLLLWTALYVGSQWFARWRDSEIQRLRLEVVARDTELHALHAQIQPHFLFNALNVLRALIEEDPARARDLVTELSELLRYALQAGRREQVTLDEELTVVESYLRVESARYEDRLTWRIQADDALRATRLPPMLVQTLVENAVKHGIASREDGGEVLVTARRDGDQLHLQVTNPGRLGRMRENSVGLANASGRLRLIYGEHARLALTEQNGHVVADVTLPAKSPS
jgi:anti-sigma regulatory factor (Ser/Thr protein kinase)